LARALAIAGMAALAAACSVGGLPIDPVVSLEAAKYVDIVRQRYDFSCGAASVATLVGGYFGEHYTELQLLEILRARYDVAAWRQRQEQGLSVEDLVYIATKIDFASEAAAIGVSGLLQIKGPVIVHLDKGTFRHFSVFRGTKDGAILLADPIFGHIQYSPGEFASQYSGVALALWKDGSDLPEQYPFAVSSKDARDEITHARKLLDMKREPLRTRF
jgi:predicted double-glycine peptidase